MDDVHYEIGEREDPSYGVVEAVAIFINGRDLTEPVREMESPFATQDGQPDLAGSYAGLYPEEVFLPSRRLLGEPETTYDMDSPNGKLAVLGCICGEPGCWPLLVRIRAGDEVVTWDNFEQPHRKHWRYDRLGPFVFDRSQYLDGLQNPGSTRAH